MREGDDWLELTDEPLPVDHVARWVVRPDCGAYVLFAGTVRDHAEGRTGVTSLSYEAYAEQVGQRFAEIAGEVRARWPEVGRVAVLHRVGRLALTDVSVVVAVSAPHRGEAFEAARWAIDTLKATAPIWKKETWADGTGWGTASRPVESVPRLAPADGGAG